MLRKLSLLPILVISIFSFSQRGKHTSAPYSTTCTVASANYQMNAYSAVTAIPNSTTLTVSNITMTSSFFTTNLAQGDLIMIIQMQGASMDISTIPTTSWGGNYTTPIGHEGDWPSFVNLWGQVTSYNNSGKYELREVRAVAGSNITLNCAMSNTYTIAGKVQVVRIPRLSNLTISANSSVTAMAWDGTIGGVVALEVDGPITYNTNAKITATGKGFRGGVKDNTSSNAPVGGATDVGFPGSNLTATGGEKGEGIGGFYVEYNALESRWGKGAPANGGGGGNAHNAGGGGGANVGTGTYYGYGVPNPTYSTAWNLETQSPSMVTLPSSGGGRGGYSYSITDQNENTVGPNNTAWGGDFRRNVGGYGGHALTYDATRLFMGGGGGAGDMNGNQGGSGGAGGGIVYLLHYGSTTGSGVVEANGAPGEHANTGLSVVANPATSSTKYGNDGAGGAGGAGAVIISNGTALPAGVTINANGGKGGDQALSYGNPTFTANPDNEADGPGGGGSGGQVSVTSIGSATQTVQGGASGIVTLLGPYPTVNFVASFPPNGATGGAAGITNTISFYDINVSNASICAGNSTTLTASVVGTLPGGTSVTWYSAQYGGAVLTSGLTYTTPTLAAGTYTYYVGTCPGTFRKPVTVTVGGPTITGTAVITNATCSTAGSITGLSTTGGVPTVTIQWNGVTTPTMDLSSASPGTYNVVVTDGIGCNAAAGPFIINSSGGPTINTTGMVVTNVTCSGGNGSITGITATGTGLTYSWTNTSQTTLNIGSLNAGAYTLTVTDNNNCTAVAGPINVGTTSGPVIDASGLVVTNETCGNSNGSIVGITATGTGLTYQWNGNSTANANYTGLGAGTYNLVVMDNLGCTANYGPVNIVNTPGPTIDISNIVINDGHCGSNSGSISGIQVNGGLSGYTYNWNSGAYNTLNISNLAAGNYSLLVTDANGCNANAGPFTVAVTPNPTISLTGMVITPETCNNNNGAISGITATGSGLTYSYNLVSYPGLDVTNLNSGNYILIVTDQYGCSVNAGPINVPNTPPPTINSTNVVITNETCTNANGSITGLVVTGTGLTFDWNGILYPTQDITDLSAGSYTLTMTDANNCVVTYGPINITNTPSPTIDISTATVVEEHCGQTDGSITGVTVSGGQTPYGYSWNAGAYTTLDLSNIDAANYILTVTDFNGCTATSGPILVNELSGPIIDAVNVDVSPETCAGNDGSITGITVTGSNLTYEWNGTVSASLDLLNLSAGNYSLEVLDAFGCSATSGPYTIAGATVLTIDSTNLNITLAGCTVDAGAIEGLQILGGINPQFSWDNSNVSLDNIGLSSGSYTLTVTDDQGCNLSTSFYVGQTTPPVINVNAVVFDTAHCGQNDGGVSGLVVTGGTGAYVYQWDGVVTNNSLNISNVTGGNHTFLVTDAMGCTDTEVLSVPSQAGPVINEAGLSITNSTCEQANGEIEGVVISGNGPFVTTWTNTSLTSLDITGLNAGTYTLTVEDVYGCISTSNPMNVTTTPNPVADFGYSPNPVSPNDLVTFVDESTNAPITTWSWLLDGVSFGSNASTTNLFTTEGDYSVTLTVTTANGCTDNVTQLVQVIGELVIPNVITRNGDEVNDLFIVKNLKPNTKLVVLNRWGSVVYSVDDYKNDWNGEDMSGARLSEGTYFYQLITVDDKIYQGNVYLLNNE